MSAESCTHRRHNCGKLGISQGGWRFRELVNTRVLFVLVPLGSTKFRQNKTLSEPNSTSSCYQVGKVGPFSLRAHSVLVDIFRVTLKGKEKKALFNELKKAKNIFFREFYKPKQNECLEIFKKKYLNNIDLIASLVFRGIDIMGFWYVILFIWDYIETIDPNPCQNYNTPRESFEKVLDLLNKITDDNFYELKPVFTLKVKNNTTVKMEAINTLNMLKGQIEHILKTNNCELDVRLERLKRQPTLDDVFADDLSDLSVCKKQPKQYKIYLFREFLMGYLEQYESKEKKIPIEEIVQDYVVKDGDKLVSVDKELIIARLLYVVGYINETKLRNTVKDNKFIKSGLKGINSEKIVKRSKVYW